MSDREGRFSPTYEEERSLVFDLFSEEGESHKFQENVERGRWKKGWL